MLEDLNLASSETCCEGLFDPTEYIMPKSSLVMSRVPFADVFQKNKIIDDSFLPASKLYAVACRYSIYLLGSLS